MTLESIVSDRFAQWWQGLLDYGYADLREIAELQGRGAWGIRASRSSDLGPPRVEIAAKELWVPGHDPAGHSPTFHACYLHTASWHAQIDREHQVGAERFEIDREKPAGLVVHRHPYRQVNDVRVPDEFLTPEAWLNRVEIVVAELYYQGEQAE